MNNKRINKLTDLSQLNRDCKVNLFICYSPFQVYVANIILANEDNKSTVSILIKQQQITVNHNFNYFIETRAGFHKIIDVRLAKKTIDFVAEEFKDVNFFIPHTGGLLTHYIFDLIKAKHKAVNVNLFYEGVLFLYDYDYSFHRKNVEIRQRYIVSFLLGLNYKFQSVIYPGYSEGINHIYTFFPNITKGIKNKIREIKINQVLFQPVKNRVIILGQKASLLNEEQHKIIYLKMIDDLTNDGLTDIYYKPHYSDFTNSFAELAAKKDLKYTPIAPFNPIEEVIGDYKPERVVSIISSGLINLSVLLGKAVELRSYCPTLQHSTIKSETLNKMREVFRKVGIPNVDINL